MLCCLSSSPTAVLSCLTEIQFYLGAVHHPQELDNNLHKPVTTIFFSISSVSKSSMSLGPDSFQARRWKTLMGNAREMVFFLHVRLDKACLALLLFSPCLNAGLSYMAPTLIHSIRPQHLDMKKTESPSFLQIFSFYKLLVPWFYLHPSKASCHSIPPYLQSITESSSADLLAISWISFLSIVSVSATALDQICSCLTLIAARRPVCKLPPLWTLQSVLQMWARVSFLKCKSDQVISLYKTLHCLPALNLRPLRPIFTDPLGYGSYMFTSSIPQRDLLLPDVSKTM